MKTMLVVLFAFFWTATTTHCSWERLPGFEFLACDDSTSAAPCEGDTCCAVEHTDYLPSQSPPPTVTFVAAILPVSVNPPLETVQLPFVAPKLQTASPPELPASWQFVLRTALPVRPPSIIS